MLCDAKPITIQPVPQLLHMHNHSSSTTYMFTASRSAMLLCSWTMASSIARYLCGVHAVLFAVESIILLPSNCCFSLVLTSNSIARLYVAQWMVLSMACT